MEISNTGIQVQDQIRHCVTHIDKTLELACGKCLKAFCLSCVDELKACPGILHRFRIRHLFKLPPV